jgi:SAM-dependent methyltransferase
LLEDSPLSDAIERIFETELPVRPKEPTLHAYYGDLRKPQLLEKYLRYHEGMLHFAGLDPDGKDVLDVGSGFGVVLVWLASRGARAHGLEIVSWQVDDVHTYLNRLTAEIRDRVTVRRGSASQMPYGDSSFDLVLAIEAVSHYLDYTKFLTGAHRVLRPGGKLLIVDGNNGLNPAIRRRCERIWALHERDIVDDEDPWLFVPRRQRIIEKNFPQLDAPEAHTLALQTSGMVQGQVGRGRTHLPRD